MPISKHKGRFRFFFNRVIAGRQIRASKLLPEAWTRAQADRYDLEETARLFAQANGHREQDPKIEDAVLLYIKEHCPTLKTGKAVEKQLAYIYPFYQGRNFSDLPDVATKIRSTNDGARTKQSNIAIIRAACRYAWKVHGLGNHDPAERIVLPKVSNARHYYASRREMLQIAWHCRPNTRPFIRIAFYSGMRLGEILRAEVMQDFMALRDTKNGEPRLIPIHPKIQSAVERHIPPRVAKSTIQDHFREARKAAGLEHFRFHDMRHSAASEMVNAGIDLYTVGAVLGHKDARSTKRYAHLNTQTLASAIRKIGKV